MAGGARIVRSVVICAAHAPDDRSEGCYRVVTVDNDDHHIVHVVGGEWISGPYTSAARAIRQARVYAREYDDVIREIPADVVRVERAAAREVVRLRRLLAHERI